MTVPATARRAGPFTGTGVLVSYPFTFKVFEKADVQVTIANTDAVESTLVLDSSVLVTLNVDQDATPGGSVQYAVGGVATPLPAGYSLVITSDGLTYEQTADLPQGGNFSPVVVENALDRQMMLVQNLRDDVGRSLTLPVTAGDVDTTLPAPEANKFVAWNASASALQNVDVADLATIAVVGTGIADTFTGTGTQTVFTLSENPGAQANLDVSVGGVVQLPTTDYAWGGGTTLTFTAAPPAGVPVLVRYVRALPQGTADAAAVEYMPAGTGAVSRTVHAELRDAFASVKDFGAVGNGSADDTAAVLAGVAHLKALGGGTLYFPQGTYKVTSEILIDSPGIMFKGTGRRKCYPGVLVPSANTASTIMPVHAGRNCIRIFNASLNVATTLTFEDINFATLETGSRPTAAFGFDGSGNFHRDYVWERCGIHGFTSAFDTYNTGGDMAFGVARVSHCTISRNNWIARNLTGQWNGFVFRENEAGQQLTGGFDLKGHAIAIVDNLLEGQPDVIKISGNYRGIRIEGNYFEATSGAYTIWLSETVDAHIGKNTWLAVTSTEPVRLYNDVNTRYMDTMPPSTKGSWFPQLENNVVGPTGIGSASCALLYDSRLVSTAEINSTEIGGFTTSGGANASPHKTIPNSVGASVTTSGTGILTFTKGSLALPADTWFAVSIVVSYDSTPAKEPVMELRVNSGITDGYANPTFYNFTKTNVNLKDRTVVYWGVVKATAAVTSFQVLFYPYGISPAAGLTYTISQPEIYNMGTTLPTQRDSIGIAHPSVPHKTLFTAAAVPSAGTWQLRHQILQSSPAAAGFIGWVCTTAGTPGTWKTFGAITP